MTTFDHLKIDKRFKIRKYFRITHNGTIQFSDTYDAQRGFIGHTQWLKMGSEDQV